MIIRFFIAWFLVGLYSCGTHDKATPRAEAPPPVASLVPSKLTIKIQGLKHTEGQVCLSVFDSDHGFPDDISVSVMADCFPAADTIVLEDKLNQGSEYGISLFHDENGNHVLDKIGPFGIPKEPFGFSNNPKISFGPPDFSSVKFNFDHSDMVITITLVNLLG
jgi:uncharacterized protein (DUF2141 family)